MTVKKAHRAAPAARSLGRGRRICALLVVAILVGATLTSPGAVPATVTSRELGDESPELGVWSARVDGLGGAPALFTGL